MSAAILALASGQVFYGESIGIQGESCGELVFNTAMTGYQEILTDPSYASQIITFTYPHIGNTGINDEDDESRRVFATGLVIGEQTPVVSNWRANRSLNEFLIQQQIVGIAGIDTRYLTRLIREQGAQHACIMTHALDEEKACQRARDFEGLSGKNLATMVSTRGAYHLNPKRKSHFHVVLVDYGVKQSIIDNLLARGCRLTVLPAMSSAEDILACKPDGIVLSNGPGDPQACQQAIAVIRSLTQTNIPIFGICLGFQMLALSFEAKTLKMKFGHHGANHPVQDLSTKQVMITSQNHGFAVDELSLPQELKVTHTSLFDGSLQGFAHRQKPIFGVQGHPEAGPGPNDAKSIFKKFIEEMRAYQLSSEDEQKVMNQ